MSTTKIKCACDWLGCKARIVVRDNTMWVYNQKEDIAAIVLLPEHIAKAIRDAVKAMEDDH